jgi:hypothetical protein
MEALGKCRLVMCYSIKGEGNVEHIGLSSRRSGWLRLEWGRSMEDGVIGS